MMLRQPACSGYHLHLGQSTSKEKRVIWAHSLERFSPWLMDRQPLLRGAYFGPS